MGVFTSINDSKAGEKKTRLCSCRPVGDIIGSREIKPPRTHKIFFETRETEKEMRVSFVLWGIKKE